MRPLKRSTVSVIKHRAYLIAFYNGLKISYMEVKSMILQDTDFHFIIALVANQVTCILLLYHQGN